MVLEIAQFEIKPGMDAGRRSHQCRAFLAAKPEKTKDYRELDGFGGCLTIQTVPGHTVRHVEKGYDTGNVPDVALAEASLPQLLAISFLDQPRRISQLDGGVEHGAMAWFKVGGAIVHDHHLTEHRITGQLSHRGAVRR